MKRYFLLLLAVILLLSGCKEEAKPETVPVETTLAAETEAPTEETAPREMLLTRKEDGKVCVGIVPTEIGAWRYVVIEDQEAAAAAFEKAVNAKYSDEWWIKGDRTIGLMVVYNGEYWDFVESGELVNALGRVKAEDAAELYALCAEAAREAGWQEGVKPQQITGLVSATLSLGEEEHRLTDAAALETLERILSGGKFVLGGTGCPFGALLDMTLETGEILTIALATDSCGIWMSEGNYYDFGSGNQPLYDLFDVTLDFGESSQ